MNNNATRSTDGLNNEFYSSSTHSFNSASFCPSDIKNRLPNVVFTGPNTLYNHRVKLFEYPHEIGIGKASSLRTLDIGYLSRGKSGVLMNARRDHPGEIGWSYSYFKNIVPGSSSHQPANSFSIPR